MRYCQRCLYPANHPLFITFDEQGVCSGCRIHEEKDRLDWSERGEKLRKILNQFRNVSGRSYDCVIPVSGARDSYFIVHTIKNVYKMNPLLVCYNKHYNTKVGIRNLAYLRTRFDCDLVMNMPAPQKLQKITRETLRLMGSMYWHCLAGHTVYAVQTAVRVKVPLIIWGVHQGCDQVGMFSHMDEVEMTRKYRKDHDVMGWEAEDLLAHSDSLTENEVRPFIYPHDKEIEKVGVRGVYLSNYIRWDTKRQHEWMIDLYGYETLPQCRTFDTYNDVDCFHYSGTHDYIKFLKYGYGKVTDHATREIRFKRLTREEGIQLVQRYQNVRPRDLSLILEWLGMSESDFFECVNRHRDPRIWQDNGCGDWQLLDSIVNHIDDPVVEEARLGKIEGCDFRITPARDPNAVEDKYVLFGKGHVETPLPIRAAKPQEAYVNG